MCVCVLCCVLPVVVIIVVVVGGNIIVVVRGAAFGVVGSVILSGVVAIARVA